MNAPKGALGRASFVFFLMRNRAMLTNGAGNATMLEMLQWMRIKRSQLRGAWLRRRWADRSAAHLMEGGLWSGRIRPFKLKTGRENNGAEQDKSSVRGKPRR